MGLPPGETPSPRPEHPTHPGQDCQHHPPVWPGDAGLASRLRLGGAGSLPAGPGVPTSWGAWKEPQPRLLQKPLSSGCWRRGLGGAGGPWVSVVGAGTGRGEMEPRAGEQLTALCNGELTAAPARNDGRRREGPAGELRGRGACAAEGCPGAGRGQAPLVAPRLPLLARCWQDLDVRTTGLLSRPGPSGEQLGALGGGVGCPLLRCSRLGGRGAVCCSGVPLLSLLLPDARPLNASLLPSGLWGPPPPL